MKVLQGSHLSLWSFSFEFFSLSEVELPYQELKLVPNSFVLRNLIDFHIFEKTALTDAGKSNMIQLLHMIKPLSVKLYRVFLDT